jgi:hypothetical protein
MREVERIFKQQNIRIDKLEQNVIVYNKAVFNPRKNSLGDIDLLVNTNILVEVKQTKSKESYMDSTQQLGIDQLYKLDNFIKNNGLLFIYFDELKKTSRHK